MLMQDKAWDGFKNVCESVLRIEEVCVSGLLPRSGDFVLCWWQDALRQPFAPPPRSQLSSNYSNSSWLWHLRHTDRIILIFDRIGCSSPQVFSRAVLCREAILSLGKWTFMTSSCDIFHSSSHVLVSKCPSCWLLHFRPRTKQDWI